MKGKNKMTVHEAVGVLKKRSAWIKQHFEDSTHAEAINTVVAEVEKHLPTDEVVFRQASTYVDSIRNKIDTYCYCDVNEAFTNGATWMRDLMRGEETK